MSSRCSAGNVNMLHEVSSSRSGVCCFLFVLWGSLSIATNQSKGVCFPKFLLCEVYWTLSSLPDTLGAKEVQGGKDVLDVSSSCPRFKKGQRGIQ